MLNVVLFIKLDHINRRKTFKAASVADIHLLVAKIIFVESEIIIKENVITF